ncbi:VanZ family protein [Streptosporangium sandarakinum]|uniref:VanZ family protein n=1 Tax=Streptosporangium sandarakinum TaxID=1260955 RepID=UPI0037A785F4
MEIYLTQAKIALLLAPLAIALLSLPFVSRQYGRFGHIGRWSGFVTAMLVLYACGVVAFTLFPLPEVTPDFCVIRQSLATPRWQPLSSIQDVIRENAGRGLPAALYSRSVLQIVFNVALFVPLGFFLRYRQGLGVARTLAISLAGSLTIELTQLTGLWGLYPCAYRLFDLDDLIINTVGAGLGWTLAGPAARLLPGPWPAPRQDLAPPTAGRLALAMLLDGVVWFFASPVFGLLSVQGYRLVTGGPMPDDALLRDILPNLSYAVIGLVIFALFPAARRDGATPGRAAVHVAVCHAATGRPAPVLRRLARSAAPYLALVGGAAVGGFMPVLALLAVLELERRGVMARWTGTRLVTRAAARLGAVRGSDHVAEVGSLSHMTEPRR